MSYHGRELSCAGAAASECQAALGTASIGNERPQVLSWAPYAMMALACLGVAVAYYDSWSIYTGRLLWCPPPIDGCNEVAASPYARIFDLPVGYYGVVYYLYMLAMAALLAFEQRARSLRIAALAYAALGVLFSAYFMVLQVAYIHAFCIYCLVSAITTILLTVAAAWHVKASCPHAGGA
jgi:uncharacterized membrane protein